MARRRQAAQSTSPPQNTAQAQNQPAGLTQEQLNNTAATGLGTLGNQQMQNNIANYGMLTSAGGFEQQQAQNDINAQMAKFQQAWQYPQQQLGMMESFARHDAVRHRDVGHELVETTQTQSNPASAALGGLQTLGGLFSSGAGGTSAMSGLMAMLGGSDRRLKTDIVRRSASTPPASTSTPIATRAIPSPIRRWSARWLKT